MNSVRRDECGGSLPARTEIVLTTFDESTISEENIGRWIRYFNRVRVAASYPRATDLIDERNWVHIEENRPIAGLWNELLCEADSEFVLFLLDGEDVHPDKMPEGDAVAQKMWAPVFTTQKTESGIESQFYQLRFIPASARHPFEGKNLPDCTGYVFEEGITLSETPVEIETDTLFTEQVKPEDELSVKSPSPQVYLIQAAQLMKEAKYIQAGALYKKLLNRDHLLPFDRLAAVNGLAASYTEQFRWPQAVSLTEQSVKAEPFQRVPYLIQYKIHELNKRRKDAFSAMQNYYLHLNQVSRANFDRSISKVEALRILGDLALKLSDHKNALRYLELLHKEMEGQTDRELTDRLLKLSIEASDYEKSRFYFGLLYDELLPHRITGEMVSMMNNHLAMFMEHGWYDYPCELYSELYSSDRSNQEYRRRLIVTLTKTNQIDSARKLIAEAV
jgi:hypothetical protein